MGSWIPAFARPLGSLSWRVAGELCAKFNRNETALACFEQAVAAHPDCLEARQSRGVLRANLKQYDDALEDFDFVLRRDATKVDAHLERAHVLTWIDRREEAIEAYTQVIALQPDNARALRWRAVQYRCVEEFDLALVDLQAAIELTPNEADLWYEKGRVFRSAREYEDAIAQYDRALELKPDYYDAHLKRGQALTWLDRWEEALAAFDRAIELSPDASQAHSDRGFALDGLDRNAEAIEAFARAAELNPDNCEPYCMQGRQYRELGDYESALKVLDEAASKFPHETDVWYERGRVYRSQRQFEQAVADYDRAIEVDSGNADAHIARGHALTWIDRREEAIESYTVAASIRPDDPWPLHARCKQNRCVGLYEEAHEDIAAALKLAPDNPTLLLERARCWWWQDDVEEAIEDCEAVLRLRENSPAWELLGQLHAYTGDHETAIDSFNESLRIDPDNENAQLHRGVSWRELGDREQALADFNAAIEAGTTDADSYTHRAQLFRDLGKHERAIEDYTQALQLDSRNKNLLRRRAECHEELGDYTAADDDYDALVTSTEELETEDMTGQPNSSTKVRVLPLLREHFGESSLNDLSLHDRKFTALLRPDIQRSVQAWVEQQTVDHCSGVSGLHNSEGLGFTDLLVGGHGTPVLAVPIEHDDIDIGEEEPIRCARIALWLLTVNGVRCAVLYSLGNIQVRVQLAVLPDEPGEALAAEFLRDIDDAFKKADCYRGKVLSLEGDGGYGYSSSGVKVHRLRDVARDEIILPEGTVQLLDRNVIRFADQRDRLRERGLSTKKGLLFYGPPGTGKTHTIHYLTRALQGHTTLLITAGEVGILSEYMKLARLFSPSVVVIEDVDLIARDRAVMRSTAEECLLNSLLNEMDGLKEDADIMFILTTNAPESLEDALAARPGRIDQAIEFPLPDEEGRRKLAKLYAARQSIEDEVIDLIADRTAGVSAAFIKELMRRAIQHQFESGHEGALLSEHIESALEEILVTGGSLNAKLLGGDKARRISGFSSG